MPVPYPAFFCVKGRMLPKATRRRRRILRGSIIRRYFQRIRRFFLDYIEPGSAQSVHSCIYEPTEEVLQIAPSIIRCYCISFLLLPVVAGADAIWFAMPITELLVAVYVVYKMVQYTRGTAEERKVFA